MSCFLISIFLCSCNKNNQVNQTLHFSLLPADSLTRVEKLLYQSLFTAKENYTEAIIVCQQTRNSIYIPFASLVNDNPQIDTAIIDFYLMANDTSNLLDSILFSETTGIRLVPEAEVDYLTKNPEFNYSWDKFYERYPNANGIIELSMIGFNTDSTQALVSKSLIQPYYQMDLGYLMYFKDGAWCTVWHQGIETHKKRK